MRYKKFANAGVDVSAMTIGSMVVGSYNFNDELSDEFIKTVPAMVDKGINIIDTAPRYGNGTSEKVVGRAVQGIRDKVYIATKFGTYRSISSFDIRNASYSNIMRECQNSLLNMGIDYIDFYITPWPDKNTPMDEQMAALNDLKKKGCIRYIGFSNCDKAYIEEAMKYGQVDVIQVEFSLVNQKNRELMEWATANGIGVMTYGSLGSGILTGTIRNRDDINKTSHLSLYDFFNEPKFSNIMILLKTLDKMAEKYNVPVPQVALNWSTQQDFVGTALVGTASRKIGLENCAAFDWQLSEEDIAEINAEAKRLNIV
ncbi:MAG: aldo/keto reductase [Erysipelotrichaceae bacterium]|nr:aldo/keto reductase [Erysipelotrichaceae bacterium]